MCINRASTGVNLLKSWEDLIVQNFRFCRKFEHYRKVLKSILRDS